MHPCCCWASVSRKCNSIHFRIHPSVSCHIINKNWWPRAIASHTDPCNLYIMVWYIYLLGSCVFFPLSWMLWVLLFFFKPLFFFKSWKGFHDHPLLLFSVSSFTNLMNQWTNLLIFLPVWVVLLLLLLLLWPVSLPQDLIYGFTATASKYGSTPDCSPVFNLWINNIHSSHLKKQTKTTTYEWIVQLHFRSRKQWIGCNSAALNKIFTLNPFNPSWKSALSACIHHICNLIMRFGFI